ncbi:oligosaccharide flippase family protein [uncultured Proteiniphilum sp.]|uniref:lipopolysaccharide biosynthesis protein n=1 Tax=uncultured Proteiniphilum sp. TaxID=497637 RepID=UPI002618F912|nr:oligosaccharide flippase family protein [uncultured Proteiniphilum sp.]
MSRRLEYNIYTLGVKNILSSFLSQIIVLSVGIVLSFVLPVVIGIEQFGYWQVYLLYVTFAMFFGLGFTDGIYLTYGKYDYKDLPYERLRSTLLVYTITAIIFTTLALFLALEERDTNKQFALVAATLNIFVLLLSNAGISILQFTNRIKEYSFIVAIGKLLLLLGIVLLIVLNICNFKTIIVIDLFAKVIILTINILLIKEIFFGKVSTNYQSAIKEWYKNVKIGIKIMLAVYASTFVMNIGRILIERFDGIKIYSSYALAVSISSFFLVFVSSFSLSFYPFIRRVNESKWSSIYSKMNTFIFFISFVILGCYYPLNYIIRNWYVDYISVTQYLPLFLVMTLMQGKEQFLHVTYMKALRKENKLLLINIIFSIIACLTLIPVYLSTKSAYWVAFITNILIIAKSYCLELYLRKKELELEFKNIFSELLLIILFISITYFSGTFAGLLIFILVTLIYFTIKRHDLINFTRKLFREFRSK